MPKKAALIRFTPVKAYINRTLKIRSSDGAVRTLLRRFNATLAETLAEAKRAAQQDKRNTILTQHMTFALEKQLGRQHLSWEALTQELLRQPAAEIGKISKAIETHLQQQARRKREKK